MYDAVTDNIKTNKDHYNDANKTDPDFDNSFNFSNGTKEPLPVVTVSLRGGKKQRAKTVAGITRLLDSGATGIMIKKRYTKYYEGKIRSNKV